MIENLNTETLKTNRLTGGILINADIEDALEAVPLTTKFDIIIADPPYNIGKDFGEGTQKIDISEYTAWSFRWIEGCLNLLADDGIMYIYGFPEIIAHIAVKLPLDKQRWLVWHYTNKTVPRLQFWQRSHETILCVWKEEKPAIEIDNIREPYTESFLKNSAGKTRKITPSRYGASGKETIYEAHKKGALPRDVIKIPALAGGAGFKERYFMCETCDSKVFPPNDLPVHKNHATWKHPTQKPSELTRKLLLSKIREDETAQLLIPFAGSGSEIMVAESLNVVYLAIEKNEKFVDFAVKWSKLLQSELELRI